jgi:hypothetical protein
MPVTASVIVAAVFKSFQAGLPQRQGEVPQMELKNADRPGWAQMTRRVCRWTGAPGLL